jgi:hypothetical protein
MGIPFAAWNVGWGASRLWSASARPVSPENSTARRVQIGMESSGQWMVQPQESHGRHGNSFYVKTLTLVPQHVLYD